MRRRVVRLLSIILAAAVAAACSADEPASRRAENPTAALVSAAGLSTPECSGSFRVTELPHTVEARQAETEFDANGAGVAVGDLDGDDRLDIVLGNLDGPIRVFWNRVDGTFEEEVLLSGRARAVQLVDVDADRDLDIVLAPGLGPPIILANGGTPGKAAFSVTTLAGITAPAYSMLWFDPDGDGDLDAVVGAYDMEFGEVIAREFVSDARNGLHYLEQIEAGVWTQTQLAEISHALAMTAVDLDADGDDDIVVGNDFGLPDQAWLWNDGWTPAPDLFETTAANTMSFDVGDVDADGDDDLYATDMVPYGDRNVAFWIALSALESDPPGPQLVQNVLLDLGDGFENTAAADGIEASGWSWSGRLLDLDNDRDLDLYVGNGMLASPLFPAFPTSEGLVEPNVAFRNAGDGSFDHATDWELGDLASTRGIAAGDLDGDGDLDLVTSTVEAPARVFVNELCGGGSLTVRPVAASGGSVFGATVTIGSSSGEQSRTLRSGVGYLAADPSVAHFGLGDEEADWVQVEWPDGTASLAEGPFRDVALTVTQEPVSG